MLGITTLIACLLAPGIASAEIYKWTDDAGRVHYDEKPKDRASEPMVMPKNYKKPATPPPDETQRFENIRKWTDARQKEREAEKLRQAELEEKRAKREKRCNKLKNDLADMERGGISWYRLDENGQRQYYSDDEIMKEKNDLENSIKKNCH